MIEEFSKEHALRDLCEFLGVSRSGYYAWQEAKESARDQANRQVLGQIKQVFQAKRGRYGSPRITQELRRRGQLCNHKRVERLMRQKGSERAAASAGRCARPKVIMPIRLHLTCF